MSSSIPFFLQAKERFENALKINPNNSLIRRNMGQACWKICKVEKCLQIKKEMSKKKNHSF